MSKLCNNWGDNCFEKTSDNKNIYCDKHMEQAMNIAKKLGLSDERTYIILHDGGNEDE